MTAQSQEQALAVIKNVLHVLYEKRYEDLPACVDEMDWSAPEEIWRCVQGTLELNGMDAFDEYGAPCNFHPQYEYHQLSFYEKRFGGGFAADYEMTFGGELTYLCLQLEFCDTDGGLKSLFHTIDPQYSQ